MGFKKEIKIGSRIEMEHKSLFPKSKQKLMAKRIAMNHINEFPQYYSRGLVPMEKRLKLLKGGKKK